MSVRLLFDIPDDLFQALIFAFMTLLDIVTLDNAVLNHRDRVSILSKYEKMLWMQPINIDKYLDITRWMRSRGIIPVNLCIFNKVVRTDDHTASLLMYCTTHLKRLKIRNVVDCDESDKIFSHLSTFSLGLTCVDLYRVFLNNEIVEWMLRSCKCLDSLTIQSCSLRNEITMVESCTALKVLSFCDTSTLTDRSFRSLIKCCPNLQSLNIQNCHQLTNEAWRLIGEHCPHLTSINLSINVFYDFVGNYFLPNTGPEDINAAVLDVVKRCLLLEQINLGGLRIDEGTMKSIVTTSMSLRHLDLSDCPRVSDEVVRFIAEHSSRLVSIRFRTCFNNIHLDHRAFLYLLQCCHSLRALNIDRCPDIDVEFKRYLQAQLWKREHHIDD